MLLRWLLPSDRSWLLHMGSSPATAGFFTVGVFTTGEGCSSLAGWFLHCGSRILLTSNHHRFLQSGMFLRWFLPDGMLIRRTSPEVAHALDHDLLLPFPEILGLGVASSRLQLVVRIFAWISLLQN
ncbi:hypothetical protein GW17_00056039 [Ensete ventricosum]|nr:hypothetical protein GW17_00056039 [Ensete ventricosum]RZS18244.1 hypothetical protein BHM03_00050480 [Ensete ventricosum]